MERFVDSRSSTIRLATHTLADLLMNVCRPITFAALVVAASLCVSFATSQAGEPHPMASNGSNSATQAQNMATQRRVFQMLGNMISSDKPASQRLASQNSSPRKKTDLRKVDLRHAGFGQTKPRSLPARSVVTPKKQRAANFKENLAPERATPFAASKPVSTRPKPSASKVVFRAERCKAFQPLPTTRQAALAAADFKTKSKPLATKKQSASLLTKKQSATPFAATTKQPAAFQQPSTSPKPVLDAVAKSKAKGKAKENPFSVIERKPTQTGNVAKAFKVRTSMLKKCPPRPAALPPAFAKKMVAKQTPKKSTALSANTAPKQAKTEAKPKAKPKTFAAYDSPWEPKTPQSPPSQSPPSQSAPSQSVAKTADSPTKTATTKQTPKTEAPPRVAATQSTQPAPTNRPNTQSVLPKAKPATATVARTWVPNANANPNPTNGAQQVRPAAPTQQGSVHSVPLHRPVTRQVASNVARPEARVNYVSGNNVSKTTPRYNATMSRPRQVAHTQIAAAPPALPPAMPSAVQPGISQASIVRTPDQMFEITEQTGRLQLAVRRSKLLRTKVDIYRTSVVDASVCDVIQFTPREIQIIGKSQGATNITFWFKDGKHRSLTYLVTVTPDIEARREIENQYQILQDVLRELFPDSKVRLLPIADKLIVRGQAKDSEEAAQIMAIIRGQASQNSGRMGEGTATNVLTRRETGRGKHSGIEIINMLRIPGVQQVALRVKIAELNRTAARSFGIDVNAKINISSAGSLVIQSLLNSASGGTASVIGNFDGDDVSLGIHYLEQHGVLRVLSEPTLVTLSGHPATFVAGGEFAVPTVVGSVGLNAVTTDFRSFGAIISFLPVVIDKDRIRLEVSPEFSKINSKLNVGGTPGLDVRAVTTTIEMREGQTLAIAGLLDDSMTANSAGDLPFLANLFGRRSVTRNETELIILVTPELVHPMEPEEVPPLPGFDVTEPTNSQFYLGGRLEGTPTIEHRSTVWPRLRGRYRAGGSSMISGPFGHGE